jgi:ABC-type amino acid transport substrate-binding protein
MIYGRKNIFISVVVLTLLVMTLTPAVAATAPVQSTTRVAQTEDDVLTIGTDISYPLSPDVEGDARTVALGIELMDRVANELGYDVQWVTVPTDGIMTALEAGELDFLVSTLTITDEFEDILSFSDPYFVERHGLFIRYPVMNTIADNFGLQLTREVDFTIFEAVNALAVAVNSEEAAGIASAIEELAVLIQALEALPLPDATEIAETIAESEYIVAPDALVEPLIHTNRLGDKRIGMLPNSEDEAFFTNEAPDAEIVTFETLEAAFEALEQGEIDGVFAPTRQAKAVVSASENVTAILVNRRTLMVQREYGIGAWIDPDHEDKADNRIGLIEDAVESLIIDGTVANLMEKWVAVASPGSVVRTALESMFGNDYSGLYQVMCEASTYSNDIPSPDDLAALNVAEFDFSNLRFDTQVERNGSEAEVNILGTYSVRIGETSEEYDATTMFDEEILIEMIYDGDNWLFCPELR